MAESASFKYRAFVSYSHRDKAWGEWLHGALEGYRIDKNLVGRETTAGPVPATLRRVFRDREDFSAGQSLTEQTLAALAVSKFLVVVCSPHAAQSKYVNEEILRFKAMAGAERVIAIIVDGEPGDPARECFPAALRFKVGPDGALTGEPEEPIAADARRDGDGKRLALLKVIAGLLGVPLDDVRKREAIVDSRRIKIAAAGALVVAILVLFAGYLLIEHQRQLALELARNEAAQQQYQEQQRQSREQAQRLADTKSLVEKLLASRNLAPAAPGVEKAVETAVDAATRGAATGDSRLQRALEFLKAGNVNEAEPLFRAVADEKGARIDQDKKEAAAAYRNLGAIAGLADPKRARDAYARALDFDGDDLESLYWHGYLNVLAGNLQTAERSLKRLLDLASTGLDQRGLYRAHFRLADVMRVRGKLSVALGHERKAFDIAYQNSAARAADMEWQRDLLASYINTGVVQGLQGNLADALKSYHEGLAIAERLAQSDPGNTGWQRNLSVLYNNIGRVQRAQGNLAGALKSYRDGLAIRERLVQSDPGNGGWQSDLSGSYNNVGDVQGAQGDLAGALKSYRDGLAIRERLVQSDPSNAGWQNDLSGSYNNIGRVQRAQGNLAGALKSYRDGLAIRERLVQSDPGNTGWQSDLSGSYNNVGDVQHAQGDLAGALKSCRDGLAIRERLAQSDPSNAGWQRDLSVLHANLATAFRETSENAKALGALHQGRFIMDRLTKLSPDNVIWKRDLAWFDRQIAELAR